MKRNKFMACLMSAVLMMGSLSGIVTPIWAQENNSKIIFDFEKDEGGWTGRGDASVTRTEKNAKSGKACLYVTNRIANWHGVSKDITSLLDKGKEYKMGVWVKYDESIADTEQLSLTLQHKEGSSEQTNYSQIGQVMAKKGEWSYIEGKVMIPTDLAEGVLYVEAKTPELSFYIDEFSVEATGEGVVLPQIQLDIPSLKEVYKDYFKFGTAIVPSDLDEVGQEIIKKHFNSITCGNEMKPENVLDYEATIAYMEQNKGDQAHPQIRFDKAKTTLEFARDNQIPMRGHVLVWHSQTPNWFFKENYSKDTNSPNVSKEVMEERLENYIKNVFETLERDYPDVEFYAWDVVNEAVNPSTADGLRAPAIVATTSGDDGNNENANNSMWMTTMGKDSIIKAFEFARKYAPEGTLLTYNDYNECDPVKRDIMYNLCKELKEKGLLDVVGMQAHYNMSSPSITQFEEAIRKYAQLGVKIQITEMDIMLDDQSEEGYLKQAYRYKSFFDVMKKLDAEEGIDIDACILWGLRDSTSWRKDRVPLVFDKDYQAKPAFWGIVDDSKLDILSKEVKAIPKEGDSEVAWISQNGDILSTADGKEVATLKVAWDKENLYIKVDAKEGYAKEKGDITVWAASKFSKNSEGQQGAIVKEEELKESQLITIPINDLKEGDELGLEVSVKFRSDRATWNHVSYTGKSDKVVYGKLILTKGYKFTTAVYGTPTIDGIIDDLWHGAEAIDVNLFTEGNSGATAIAKTMWDKDNLYVLVQVKDRLLSKKSQNAHEQDSVEIFVDEDNKKTTTYEAGDVQYRVNFMNERSINGYPDVNSFVTATQKIEGGYIVELALPHHLIEFTEGQVIGFEVQINNDENGDGTRDSVANWNDRTGNGWSSTADYGVLQFITK